MLLRATTHSQDNEMLVTWWVGGGKCCGLDQKKLGSPPLPLKMVARQAGELAVYLACWSWSLLR